MKRPPNLNEEIAAMAKSDSTGVPTVSIENHRSRGDEKLNNTNSSSSNATDAKRKRKKNRTQLVTAIRISVSFFSQSNVIFFLTNDFNMEISTATVRRNEA